MTVFLLCIYGWSNNCENNNIRLKFSKFFKKKLDYLNILIVLNNVKKLITDNNYIYNGYKLVFLKTGD